MRLTAITAPNEVKRQITHFRQALKSAEQWKKRAVGHVNRTSYVDVQVHRDLGFWVVLEKADTQTWHVFGLIDDRADNPSTTLGHVCQVNFAYTDAPGAVAGLFAADARGRVYVIHSGRIGGGKPGVAKNAFLSYIADHATQLRTAEVVVDGARPTSRLVLGELGTPRFRTQMAAFVSLVAAFKAHVAGEPPPRRSLAKTNARGQGYERDPEVRRAVELHAMQAVEAHYRAQKYTIQRVHDQPGELDLRCTRRGVTFHVEVKGTTGGGDSVELTNAEVQRARTSDLRVDLAVLSGITVDRAQTPPGASGGTLYIYKNFNPDDHTLTPTRHRCQLVHSHGHPG